MKGRIVLTGGGTAGHVLPNLALVEKLHKSGWQVDYLGGCGGIEQTLVEAADIPFYAISTGKLRRYFSWTTFVEPLRILKGIAQAYGVLGKLKTNLVFSKGGFVAFPVVVAAWMRRIPVVAHESDMTPGLANRLSFPFIKILCVNFNEAKQHFKHPEKIRVTGTPIRQILFEGNATKGLKRAGFQRIKPCLLMMGGSQGSDCMNRALRDALPRLLIQYHVIHLCGKGRIRPELQNTPGYFQLEYANEELPDLLAASSLVVSRAGANSLCELLALKKPHLLIPLSKKVSRGDQIHNARYFEQQAISEVVQEEDLTATSLIAAIEAIVRTRDQRIERMQALSLESAAAKIIDIIAPYRI